MSTVAGTKGYEDSLASFVDASLSLKFDEVNRDFLEFLPPLPARVLDAGAGVGQNAAALARLGYEVVAIEPLKRFIDVARSEFDGLGVRWLQDSLPKLEELGDRAGPAFDFILMDGVWHHLSPAERKACIERFADITSVGGVCAISLRNGPAGAGKHVFATSCDELLSYASDVGFEPILQLENLPSLLPNKPNVVWSKVALKKLA